MKNLSRAFSIVLVALSFTISAFAQGRPSEVNMIQIDPDVTVTASSQVNANYPVANVMNADRTGNGWGSGDSFGGGWNSGNSEQYGSPTLTFQFSRMFRFTEVVVVGLQSNFTNPVEPDDSMTTVYNNPDVKLEGSGDCVDYAELGHVTGNDKVIIHFPIGNGYLARCLRLTFNTATAPQGRARVVEISGYTRQ